MNKTDLIEVIAREKPYFVHNLEVLLIKRSTFCNFFYRDIPMDHFVSVEDAEDYVLLTVVHAHAPQSEEALSGGYTTITLPRMAGRIGYGTPKLMPTILTGGRRRTLKSFGVRP